MLASRIRNREFTPRLGMLLLIGLSLSWTGAFASSLRFFGNGVNDIDRVKIRVDDPANNQPGPPADIGATDFTFELWIKATSDNSAGAISCGGNYNWIQGNIVVDRDRFNQGRTYGVSLGNGRPVFGVQNASTVGQTICGSTDLRDGAWHHLAVQRRRSDGFIWLYVDGVLEASADGPDGDISYPDNGVPTNDCSGPCDFSDPFIVIGAEKHDVGAAYPSFFGWVDEIRLSTVLRYSSNFTPPTQAFAADGNTAALYHFDEGTGDFIGDSAAGGLSPGVRRFGGNPAGPAWVADTPFAAGGSAGVLQFSLTAYSAAESGGNAQITVTRTGGSSGTVTVDYATADGTATAGADYQATMGTLTWANGVTTPRTFNVTIVDDSDEESDETVGLSLSNATGGATIGARNSATLTINDDDMLMPGQLQLSSAVYSVAEDGGTATITVTRTGGSDGAVAVDYATANGTATAGADFQSATGTLNWSDGDVANKTFTVDILDDADVEGDEIVNIGLSNIVGASFGNPQNATLTIVDDETVSPGTLQFSAGSFSVSEDNASFTVSVTRLGGSDGDVTVEFATSNGSALAGSDYEAISGNLSWQDGDASAKSFVVTIINDTADESNETVNLALGNPGGGATLGVPSSAMLTITDNDPAPPRPTGKRSGGGSPALPLLLALAGLSLRRTARSGGCRPAQS